MYTKNNGVPNKLLTLRKTKSSVNCPQVPSIRRMRSSLSVFFCNTVAQMSLSSRSALSPWSSLFCFDVYKPAKPQTPAQVAARLTARSAAREPLLSFACSLSCPLSRSLSPSRRAGPAHSAARQTCLCLSRACALIGQRRCEWQLVLGAARALLRLFRLAAF